MLSGHDVAKYFLAQTNEDAGDLMSNLKLQKLLYYAQGFHLALYDEPLFPESIEAWIYGPVVPDVYRAYKKYDSGAISIPEDIDFSKYDQKIRELLDEVYSVYGQFSAWKLLSLIHEEEPWKNSREGDLLITNQVMKKYFKTQLSTVDE